MKQTFFILALLRGAAWPAKASDVYYTTSCGVSCPYHRDGIIFGQNTFEQIRHCGALFAYP
jgi:hypothetical protein